MKRFFKTICAVGLMCAVSMLAACGGGNADSKYEGKWISVAGSALGVTLTGDEISGFGLDLQSGGKATMELDGETHKIRWSNEGETITLKVDGEDVVGKAGGDTIEFDDMLGMGMKLTFAKEGSEAAKPENNMAENDKKMLGSWQSVKVTDILGDPVDNMKDNSLAMEFGADHKAKVTLNGTDMGTYNWSMLGEWGSLDDDSVSISWDIKGENLEVNYSVDEDYFVFTCSKK